MANKESWEEIEEAQRTSAEQSGSKQISGQKRGVEELTTDMEIDEEEQAPQPKKSRIEPQESSQALIEKELEA